jgi:hypothetical protein
MKKITITLWVLVFFTLKNYAQNCVSITEPPVLTAGTATNPNVCQATTGAATITLNNNLTSEDSGGSWSLAPSSPNPNTGFDASSGTFDPNGVANGIYIFRYTIGSATCQDTEDVTVLIQNCCAPKVCSSVKVTKI